MESFSYIPKAQRLPALLACLFFVTLLCSCGGGGGGGSGGVGTGAQADGDGIILESITFPAWTDLTGATQSPPAGGPLGQQVIFTFSGTPDGPARVEIEEPAVYDSLQIYALLDSNFTGPDLAVDRDRSIIPARGVYERMGNRVVFTPYFPVEEINFSVNATLDEVPGLLPDMEYIIYVPIGLGGTISNLKGMRKTVSNPIRFTTCTADLPNLFYSNHPTTPPAVVNNYPGDGEVDVAINTYEDDLPGFPAQSELFVEFDQPLHSDEENIAGKRLDLDGDTIDDENIFMIYSAPVCLAALDVGTSDDPGIFEVNRATGEVSLIGVTRLATSPYTITGLKSIVVDGAGVMYGSSGSELYKVEYKNLKYADICRIYSPVTFGGATTVRGLALGQDGTLYGIDYDLGIVLSIDTETGAVTDLVDIGTSTAGPLWDLAVRHDGIMYAVSVVNSGSPVAISTVWEIDPYSDPVQADQVYQVSEDYTSIGMMGFNRLALYNRDGLKVDTFDIENYDIVGPEQFTLTGLDNKSLLDMTGSVTELGTRIDLVSNSYTGSKVVLAPNGILPFGTRIELLIRRGLQNISLGSLANQEGVDPADSGRIAAEADLLATFFTFDPGAGEVDDRFHEDFLSVDWQGNAMLEGLAPANWAVNDVDANPPEYEHLLATYGMSGEGNLGDFKPLGVFPTVLLDTDYQPLPLFDGSTPGVRKPTVVTGGVFNFHDIIIPADVTVRGLGSNPLIFTATGRVEITGIIDVSGIDGMDDPTFNSAFTPTPGGIGGPGGGRGGMSNPPKPEDFQLLTDLRSPMMGESGWGPSNLKQIGGVGGQCGAKGTDVPYLGSAPDDDSRGSGGGGGSFLQLGGFGYHGMGKYGADSDLPARYFERDSWWWDDGAPSEFGEEHRYWCQHPQGGDPGIWPFNDADTENDFIGLGGELLSIQGGQGGGGAGSRLDSMNPATIGAAAGWFPPLDRSAYDAKGGGGGGGGGALAIYALDEIILWPGGTILANGGEGGVGEVIGHGNFGGAGGGGSGGAVILDSAKRIQINYNSFINMSGGYPGDAKEVTWTNNNNQNWSAFKTNPCLQPTRRHRASYCNWSVGDGGPGGYGLVQLQVPDWQNDLEIADPKSIFADIVKVDWYGETWGSNAICDGAPTECGCNPNQNCLQKYYHYKLNYTPDSEFPKTYDDPDEDCLVDPAKTPTTLGPLSYGLSKWIDMGQIVHRDPVSGYPAPYFLGFTGIDLSSGLVITQNGHIPNPESNDIEVYAPDWDNGTVNYIPDENEVRVLFQGADPVVLGSKVPDPDARTAGPADITTLSGKQFIRFKVELNTAKEPYQLTPTSPKPQVNFVKIRMKY